MVMRKYQPNERDREIVLRMAAIPGVTHEAVAFCITNERTGKPINRRTLEKHYAKELETAMGVMQNLTMKSFVEQIVEHSWPATRMALANYCGMKDGADVVASVNNVVMPAEPPKFTLQFVSPTGKITDEPPPGPYDPRPLPQWPENLRDELISHPHRIEHEPTPPQQAAPRPAKTPATPEPAPTPTTYKARREALQERAALEGWTSDINPRRGGFNPNAISKNGKFV
jgi:hypothetical protein